MKKSKKLKNHKKFNIKLYFLFAFFALALLVGGITININAGETEPKDETEPTIIFSEEQIPAIIEDDKGELLEVEGIPTVEEIDGGQFMDINTGLSVNDEYADLGWSETYNVSSPEAFKNDTLNKCIIANNYYGAQCVSLARAFWWSYADRDVSTCGTGMAKGMMNCAEENAGDDFLIYWADAKDEIQAGDWLIFTGGQYGHVGMALAPVTNGYVTLLGENQGGHSCGENVGGSATNIININIKNLIGFYRPKAYIKPAPKPAPEEANLCEVYEVKWGDTLGQIMLDCTGKIEWGEAMDEYAKSWFSTKVNPNQSVFEGWNSPFGVGLYAGDVIEHKD